MLRVETGQRYELSDNQKLYLAEVESARKSEVVFRIIEELPLPAPGARIELLPALFKFDGFEWLIEKATELGAASICPWEAARTDAGLAESAVKRSARWAKIALEASQQARRLRLPVIEPVAEFTDALKREADVRLLLDEAAGAPPIVSILPIERRNHITLLQGPEGGFTSDETRRAIDAGWVSCSLGPTILRAETAAAAALSIVQSWWAVKS